MIRLWTVVLVANLAGAHLFAWVVAVTPMFLPEVQSAMLALAKEAANVTFGEAVLRGIFAGWLIAMVVWMLAAIDTGRIAVIVIITYIVGLASLTHIIAGSVEVLFLVMVGAKLEPSSSGYLVPTLIGNIIGGVSLTAAVNHAQVVAGMARKTEREHLGIAFRHQLDDPLQRPLRRPSGNSDIRMSRLFSEYAPAHTLANRAMSIQNLQHLHERHLFITAVARSRFRRFCRSSG